MQWLTTSFYACEDVVILGTHTCHGGAFSLYSSVILSLQICSTTWLLPVYALRAEGYPISFKTNNALFH